MYPSACLIGAVRLRFELLHRVDKGVRATSPSDLLPPTCSGNLTGERESDGAREEVREEDGNAVVAGAASPPRETVGRGALTPGVACGAEFVMEVICWGALAAALGTGDRQRSRKESQRPRAIVGRGEMRASREGGDEDWEW